MSEQRAAYVTATAPIGDMTEETLGLTEWERNMVLRSRQAAQSGLLMVIDAGARCWYVCGKVECNKEDRVTLPFRM